MLNPIVGGDVSAFSRWKALYNTDEWGLWKGDRDFLLVLSSNYTSGSSTNSLE